MLTREEILSMPAGRELDALVAEKVFGKNVQWTFGDEWTDSYPIDEHETTIDHYSSDNSAAWEVLELFPTHEISRGSQGYDVKLVRYKQIARVENQETMSLAIARCALLTTIQGEDKT